jgi:tetratricopeptide (TPR) repeat protein
MVARFRRLLLCIALFRPEAAFAEDAALPEVPEATEARLAFQEGLELLRLDQWASAEMKFRRSLALVPRQSTLYNLAFVLFKEGRPRKSLETLDRVRLLAVTDNARDPRYTEYAEALRPHVLAQVATLQLVVHPPDASVWVDGELAPQTGPQRTVPVDPGVHHVEASARGFIATRQDLVARAGAEIERRIALAPELRETASAVVLPSTALPERPRGRSFLGSAGPWLTIGVGGALLVSGVVTGILAKRADDDFARDCPTLINCDPALRQTRDDANRLARITDVLVVSGAVVVVGGVSWRLLTPSASSSGGRALLFTFTGAY